MAVKADQSDIDEGPSCEGLLRHNKSIKHFSLIIARIMDAVNNHTPCNKYRLSYQTSQTISSGQTAKQNIARSLQGRCFDNSYNDSQVSKKSKDAERYIDGAQNDIMYKGGTVVAWNG